MMTRTTTKVTSNVNTRYYYNTLGNKIIDDEKMIKKDDNQPACLVKPPVLVVKQKTKQAKNNNDNRKHFHRQPQLKLVVHQKPSHPDEINIGCWFLWSFYLCNKHI
jgi:hypothetical protein